MPVTEAKAAASFGAPRESVVAEPATKLVMTRTSITLPNHPGV
jgi:hypothetical protein